MSHIFYSPSANLLVEAIPKSGLNTVAISVLYLDGEPFMELEPKFNRPTPESFDRYVNLFYEYKKLPASISDIEKVAVVRNPYTRALSGFSNKNHRVLKDTEKGEQLSYDRFLEFLQKLPMFLNDGHFMPQVWQLSSRRFYKKIFSLENMDEYYDFLFERFSEDSEESKILKKIKDTKIQLNTSNSSKRYKGFLNEETSAIIENIYSDDFDLLGYSKDLSKMKEPRVAKR